MLTLVGDVGGTNSRLQLLDLSPEGTRVVYQRSYPSGAYADFHAILDHFMHDANIVYLPQVACIAAAGPVRRQQVRLTNLGWDISATAIRERYHLKQAILVNDLLAAAYGVEVLAGGDCQLIRKGRGVKQSNRAVVGVGTGFGQAILAWHGKEYIALPTESGHMNFAPQDEFELELLRFYWQQGQQASLEFFVSGKGLSRIYEYLRACGSGKATDSAEGLPEPAWVVAAAAQGDALAQQTVARFARILGSQLGNLALVALPLGGIYLVGGVVQGLLAELKKPAFARAFGNKANFSRMLNQIPIKLVTKADIGLLGAANILRRNQRLMRKPSSYLVFPFADQEA